MAHAARRPFLDGYAALADLGSPEQIVELIKEHGAQAMRVASNVAGAAASTTLGLFVFLYAFYVFLVDGPDQYAWLAEHSPLAPAHRQRLVAAFHETGRGLFIGVGLTGLSQGFVATVAYLALGVPRALVLGLLTCAASLIPSVGTALVWLPLAIGLWLSGRHGAAAILAAIGLFVIGTIDNFMRPVFSRFGRLELSTFVLLTSMFGGLAVFGGWGLLLGPLLTRMAKEALAIDRATRAPAADAEPTADAADSA